MAMTDFGKHTPLVGKLTEILMSYGEGEGRADAAGLMMHMGFELTRVLQGDQFARMWLEAAMDDIDSGAENILQEILK
jgi:hypothetical protein